MIVPLLRYCTGLHQQSQRRDGKACGSRSEGRRDGHCAAPGGDQVQRRWAPQPLHLLEGTITKKRRKKNAGGLFCFVSFCLHLFPLPTLICLFTCLFACLFTCLFACLFAHFLGEIEGRSRFSSFRRRFFSFSRLSWPSICERKRTSIFSIFFPFYFYMPISSRG